MHLWFKQKTSISPSSSLPLRKSPCFFFRKVGNKIHWLQLKRGFFFCWCFNLHLGQTHRWLIWEAKKMIGRFFSIKQTHPETSRGRHCAERNFEWKIGKKSISHKLLLGKNGKRHQAYSMKISVRLEVISEFFIPAPTTVPAMEKRKNSRKPVGPRQTQTLRNSPA